LEHLVENSNTENDSEAMLLQQQKEQELLLLEKQEETKSYKRHLSTLAWSVIGTTVFVMLFSITYIMMIEHFLELGLLSYGNATVEYFFMWFDNSFVTYLPPILIFWILFRKHLKTDLPENNYEFKTWWLLPLFPALLTLSTVINLITLGVERIFSSVFGGDGLPDVFSDVMPSNTNELLVMLLLVGIIAPICEEYIYRHLLLRPLRRYGDFLAIAVTSVLFGFFHANLTQFFYTTVAGFLLGIVAVKANSVKPAIILHAMNNSFDVLRLYFYEQAEGGALQYGMEIIGFITILVFLSGITALIIMAVKRKLHVGNSNPHLSARERTRILLTRPSIITMTVLQVIVTIAVTFFLMSMM
jgi:membrane protease YdiL (CAAX protease family)